VGPGGVPNAGADAVTVAGTSPGQVDEYLAASGGQAAAADDLPLLARYAYRFGSVSCRHGCGDCLAACPAGVEISEVLRARMYAVDYGDLALARAEYAKLGFGAAPCLTCAPRAAPPPTASPPRRPGSSRTPDPPSGAGQPKVRGGPPGAVLCSAAGRKPVASRITTFSMVVPAPSPPITSLSQWASRTMREAPASRAITAAAAYSPRRALSPARRPRHQATRPQAITVVTTCPLGNPACPECGRGTPIADFNPPEMAHPLSEPTATSRASRR